MKVKSLIIFDLDTTIVQANKKVSELILLYDIKNKTDITNYFIFYCFEHIIKTYKENKSGLLLFYFNLESFNKLKEIKSEINYKKFLNLVTKKIKFPIVITPLSFSAFYNLLSLPCAEYDEIVENYNFFVDFYDDFYKVIKKLRFHKINETLTTNIKERIKLLSI